MNILKQLINDAQTILRDMSVTQRVAVASLIFAVAIWLTGAAYLGTQGDTAKEYPLPIRIEPTEYKDVVDALKKGGFSPDYRADERLIYVPADQETKAYLYLVSEKIVTNENLSRQTLDQMVDRISFTDTSRAMTMRSNVARANSIANLVAKLDLVSEADVMFSDEKRGNLFTREAPVTAVVRVKTKFGRPLDQAAAQTIISAVALSKGGLKPDNVVVVDSSNAREFRNQDRNDAMSLANSRFEFEQRFDERLRRRIEDLVRGAIPNLHDGGHVTVVPAHRVKADRVQIANEEVREGLSVRKTARTEKHRSADRGPYEPGVQPNVVTSTVVDQENAGIHGGVRRETSSDIKDTDTQIRPSVKRQFTEVAPDYTDVTLSVMIQMPYELERDENGKAIPDRDDYDRPLLDPETRMPVFKRKPVPLMSPADLDELRLILANAAQIPPDRVAEKVFVKQVTWLPPAHSALGAEAPSTSLLRALRDNAFPIFGALVLTVVLFIVVQQTRQSLATRIDEEIEEEEMQESLAADVPEEDPQQVEMEATRARIRDAVMEDPKRAALLVRRWMNKEG